MFGNVFKDIWEEMTYLLKKVIKIERAVVDLTKDVTKLVDEVHANRTAIDDITKKKCKDKEE